MTQTCIESKAGLMRLTDRSAKDRIDANEVSIERFAARGKNFADVGHGLPKNSVRQFGIVYG
jgi:hypothetical protein